MTKKFYSSKEENARVSNLPYSLPKKLTDILYGFKYCIHEKNISITMVVDGRSGMGKTTLSGQIGLYCDPNFSLEKVFFTPDEFLVGLSNAKQGDVIIFDEGMRLSSRSSLNAINKMVVVAMSMVRSKNIIVIFNINSIFDLDRNLALHRCDLLLHVYSHSFVDRGRFMAFFKSEDQRERIKELCLLGKKFYSYSRPKANFFATFPKHFVYNEKKYEAKKQQGVNEFLKGDSSRESLTKKSRDNLIFWVKQNTDLTTFQIAEITGVTTRTITSVLKKFKDER